uniref:Uncharacterized protein n=1 Tax=Wuchereria bancrofti TaxID=6293 RepID=A0AAF5PHT2_WUCBA
MKYYILPSSSLHFTDHNCTYHVMIRLSAIKQFSSGRSPEVGVRRHEQTKLRKDKYIILVDKSGGKFDVSVDSDSFADDFTK